MAQPAQACNVEAQCRPTRQIVQPSIAHGGLKHNPGDEAGPKLVEASIDNDLPKRCRVVEVHGSQVGCSGLLLAPICKRQEEHEDLQQI